MIAIHNSPTGFHPRWIAWCQKNQVSYKLVNCFANDLIEQLKDCIRLLWHHSQNDPKALVAAKPILFALEQAGVKVFPNFNTNWTGRLLPSLHKKRLIPNLMTKREKQLLTVLIQCDAHRDVLLNAIDQRKTI